MPDFQYDAPHHKGDAGTRLDDGPRIDLSDGADEAAIVKKGHQRFNLAKSFRRPYDQPWDRFRRYYGGDQWFNKLRPGWKARPTMNYIFADIETILPTMTDQRPTINIIGKKPQFFESSELMQDAVRSVFLANEMDVKEIVLLKDAHLYGTGVCKIWYSAKRDEVMISPIDTRHFYPSPGALDIDSAEYLIVAVNRWVSAVEKDFPEFKGKLKPAILDDALTHKPVETVKQFEIDRTFVMSDTGALIGEGANAPTFGEQQIITQLEIWERDDNGQVWLTVIAGNTLLKRMKSPYRMGRPDFKGGSKYPFARCLCYPLNSQFWGMGEVAQLESPQDSINRAEAQIADLGRLCTAPYMLLHRDSRVSLKDITNRIASFIVWAGEKRPEWMVPPGVSNELFSIVDRAKLHMDNLSAVHDAARGQVPTSRISGVAIQSLQQATAGRIALKTRMFESTLKEIALQVIEIVKQFYQNKTLRYGSKYISINTILPDGNVVNDVASAEFDVEIGVGSTLPVDKGVRADQALALFQVKAIGVKELLRRSGWSEEDVQRAVKEKTQEDITTQKEMIAAQQMQAQLAPQPQGGEGNGQSPQATAGAAEEPPADSSSGLPSEGDLVALENAVKAKGLT